MRQMCYVKGIIHLSLKMISGLNLNLLAFLMNDLEIHWIPVNRAQLEKISGATLTAIHWTFTESQRLTGSYFEFLWSAKSGKATFCKCEHCFRTSDAPRPAVSMRPKVTNHEREKTVHSNIYYSRRIEWIS